MKRLGKQRVECLQILNVFAGVRDGWGNHPITRMWRGHNEALLAYTLTVCEVWTARGYRDTVDGKARALSVNLGVPGGLAVGTDPSSWQMPAEYMTVKGLHTAGLLPKWFGSRDFHQSHRSNLVRKAPDYYGPLFPTTPADLDYVWPV